MSLHLSPWHRGDVFPVNIGVYQRKWPNGEIKYCKWDGGKWCLSYELSEFDRALDCVGVGFFQGGLDWRGIVK